MKTPFLFFIFISLFVFSCKNSEEKGEESGTISLQNSLQPEQKQTYAEISVKDGGVWKDRKYEGGAFKNVTELELPSGHTDHSYYIRYEGPGWENSQIGYRLYLDWRNAIDIFGKKVDTLVLPYVGQIDFERYHHDAPWGQDILKVGKSMGIGSYGRWVNDSVAHFRTVESTRATVNNQDGESSVAIVYKGWETAGEKLDLKTVLTIYPEDRFTKAVLTPSKEVEGLCTGLVKFDNIALLQKTSDNGPWAYIATYGAQTLVNDQDQLGMAIFYKTDEVLKQQDGPYDHLLLFKPSDQQLTYYFMGTWEQEVGGIASEDAFKADLDSKLKKLEEKGHLNQ